MKFSIVTINFNNLHGLKETVDSVLGQNYRDKEMIVIDGGSKDGSAEYISQNKESFSYSVSEKDNGIYNAMNKGVAHATGDYIIFMNSGDVFFDNNVLTEVNKEIGNYEDIVYGSTLCRVSPEKAFLRKPHALEVMEKHRISAICHQSAFIKSSLMKLFLYDEKYKILGDYAFFYNCYKQGRTFHEINKIIAIYDTSGISANPKHRWRAYEELCMIHGGRANRMVYHYKQAVDSIKKIIKRILPKGVRKITHRLPNSNIEEKLINNYSQL